MYDKGQATCIPNEYWLTVLDIWLTMLQIIHTSDTSWPTLSRSDETNIKSSLVQVKLLSKIWYMQHAFIMNNDEQR